MSREYMREVISVPLVADGNPSTALAAENLAKRNRIESDLITLTKSAVIPRWMHQAVSSSPEQINEYTENSEKKRADLAARLGSRWMFREFTNKLGKLKPDEPARWNIVQEHQLLGATPEKLRKLGIMATRLLIPDVFPKESAIEVAKKFGSTVVVWNSEAYDELVSEGVKADLCRPFIHEGLHSTIGENDDSQQVVIKSSGSGMPRVWEDQLIKELSQYNDVIDWRGYFPKRTHAPSGTVVSGRIYDRIPRVYQSLGDETQLVIGQPSELIEVTAGMRNQGVSVWHVSLPPRGKHELRNLKFAIENGLTLGVLNVAGARDAKLPADCEILDLNDVLSSIDNLPEVSFDRSIIGSAGIWDSREEAA